MPISQVLAAYVGQRRRGRAEVIIRHAGGLDVVSTGGGFDRRATGAHAERAGPGENYAGPSTTRTTRGSRVVGKTGRSVHRASGLYLSRGRWGQTRRRPSRSLGSSLGPRSTGSRVAAQLASGARHCPRRQRHGQLPVLRRALTYSRTRPTGGAARTTNWSRGMDPDVNGAPAGLGSSSPTVAAAATSLATPCPSRRCLQTVADSRAALSHFVRPHRGLARRLGLVRCPADLLAAGPLGRPVDATASTEAEPH